ncbi:hypothetical protein CONPUDRAFT_78990 [Coniophora puteana RWD-64-598 SS2]|uniref:Uncharacterized protein n=1 Tax=Coniophora puteana (strain RWD-64-598) TaxID=741705 RepID=A0A5M3N5P5_CONPW|nr:uncharacterized protein CONPUDRAFT_78990 [Coniophora puteana RWD-64-598 SS2]EIW86740.1 hypothetical protein CONPUDRAFT_78990 [Coniophora puteana RWD-64-598 SS2]
MAPLERTRTTSSSRQRYTPTTRTGSNSNPQFMPDHMFVSFSGTNELRVHNVAFQDTLDVLREHVIPMWPHGVTTHSLAAHSWRVTFARNPWSASGQEGIIAQQMVCELFARLSHQGYQYLTSVNAGSSCGQLIFQDSQADENADFFVANFSSSGRRMTLVKPPRRIGEQIGARLRSAWPHKIAADRSSEQNIYTVELKRNSFGGPELDTNVFAAAALQEINFMGYKLEATVSFSRSSMWGFGGKKELWVFRGSKRSRPESRSGK